MFPDGGLFNHHEPQFTRNQENCLPPLKRFWQSLILNLIMNVLLKGHFISSKSVLIICSSETRQERFGICQNPSSLSKKVQFEQFSQFPIVSVAKQPLFLLVCPLITLWGGKNEEIWPL